MSIVSVDNIQPIGSGTTVTVNKSVTLESGNTNITGVCTATSFVGGLPITNGADNRVITASSASAIQGESGLTFDGSTLNLTAASGDARVTLIGTEGNDARLSLVSDDGDDHIDQYNLRVDASTNRFYIDQFESGSFEERFTIANGGLIGINTDSPSAAWLDIATDIGNYDHLRMRRISSDSNIASNWSMKPYGGHLYFREGGSTDKIQFMNGGDLYILDGNLRVASGHGIDFGATADTSATGASTSSELLDDYEEGSWTPSFLNVNAPNYSTQYGRYCRNGSLVQLTGQISVSSGLDTSDGSTVNIGGLPIVGNSAAESCIFTFGRYTNLIPNSKLAQFSNARFGGNYVMLLEGNNADISYAECNSSGTIQFSISYIVNT